MGGVLALPLPLAARTLAALALTLVDDHPLESIDAFLQQVLFDDVPQDSESSMMRGHGMGCNQCGGSSSVS